MLEANGKLVVTTDAIVEGVHFLPDDPIETVAKKALRVNVSDIVAKGAKPIGALLTLAADGRRRQMALHARAVALGSRDFHAYFFLGDEVMRDAMSNRGKLPRFDARQAREVNR